MWAGELQVGPGVDGRPLLLQAEQAKHAMAQLAVTGGHSEVDGADGGRRIRATQARGLRAGGGLAVQVAGGVAAEPVTKQTAGGEWAVVVARQAVLVAQCADRERVISQSGF